MTAEQPVAQALTEVLGLVKVPEAAARVVDRLPKQNVELAALAAVLTSQAVDHYQGLAAADAAAYEPDLARSLNSLGVRLWGLGRREEALAATQRAVAIRERLAAANAAAYEPDLARGLWGFAWVRVEGGVELEQALASATRSVEIYRRLARRLPAVFTDDLRAARATLADALDALGRSEEAERIRQANAAR